MRATAREVCAAVHEIIQILDTRVPAGTTTLTLYGRSVEISFIRSELADYTAQCRTLPPEQMLENDVDDVIVLRTLLREQYGSPSSSAGGNNTIYWVLGGLAVVGLVLLVSRGGGSDGGV